MQNMTAFPFTSKMTFDEKGWPQLDRSVTSKVLRKILKNYYVNGVFGINDSACLQVTAPFDESATVKVKPGVCLIQGATGYIEKEVTLELKAGDTLPRIDTVVARLNDNTNFRSIYIDIISGTPASVPQPPALTQSDSIWEIGLADLRRNANSTIISDSNITDTRMDTSRCGYVTAINKLDTKSLMQQFNAYYNEFVDKSDSAYGKFLSYMESLETSGNSQLTEILNLMRTFENASEAEFKYWFQGVQDVLASVENGKILEEVRRLLEDMYRMATDDDIDRIIGGTYVDDDNEGSLFEAGTNQDIDDIIGGTYVDYEETEDTEQKIKAIIDNLNFDSQKQEVTT